MVAGVVWCSVWVWRCWSAWISALSIDRVPSSWAMVVLPIVMYTPHWSLSVVMSSWVVCLVCSVRVWVPSWSVCICICAVWLGWSSDSAVYVSSWLVVCGCVVGRSFRKASASRCDLKSAIMWLLCLMYAPAPYSW